MSSTEINSKRKEGLLDEALEMAEREYAAYPDKFIKNALFWCLNDKLKQSKGDCAQQLLQRMKELALVEENTMLDKAIQNAEYRLSEAGQKTTAGWNILKELKAANEQDIVAKKQLLLQYVKLGLHGPSTLHSCIMKEALKAKKTKPDDFTFSAFAQMWGFGSFAEADWEQTLIGDGKKMSSNVEKAIVNCVKEMHDGLFSPTPEFQVLLESAIAKFPSNIHLLRYKAQLLTRDGKTEQAIEAYKQLIGVSHDKFFLWDDLAELTQDADLKIGLLCGAITSGAHDEFLVNVRLQLAELLCNRQMYSNAKTELEIYKRVHVNKGWPLKRKFTNAVNRLPASTAAADNRELYKHYKEIAEAYIYSDYPDVLVVKNWEKKDKFNGRPSVSWQLRSATDSFWLKPRKFGLDANAANGSVYHAKIANGQIVSMKATDMPADADWLKCVEGNLSVKQQGPGKPFGFVNDIFIPSQQLPEAPSGAKVGVVAVKQSDGRWISLNVSVL